MASHASARPPLHCPFKEREWSDPCRSFLPGVAAVLIDPLSAQQPPAPAATTARLTVPYELFRLPNGLTVILHEDHSVPQVAVNVWYHVGSAREKPGRTGFAHLFEHLMFEGSGHVKEGCSTRCWKRRRGHQQRVDDRGPDQLLRDGAVERPGPGALSRVRSDGLLDVVTPQMVDSQARCRQERAAPELRERPVWQGVPPHDGAALPEGPSVLLAGDRLHGRPLGRHARRCDRLLQEVLRAGQRQSRRGRRHHHRATRGGRSSIGSAM